jgi:hypothetical protein
MSAAETGVNHGHRNRNQQVSDSRQYYKFNILNDITLI